jgi:NADPH:quinone reductase-like Zn-dependent oxidoreductase
LYFFLNANAEDLGALRGYVEEGKLRPVVGTVVKLRDMEKMKKACEQVYEGKGGIGKTVILVK